MRLLTEACKRIRVAAPGQRCAVYFGQTELDRALYELVCEEDSPVDVVGFSLYSMALPQADPQTLASAQATLPHFQEALSLLTGTAIIAC